MSDEEGLDVAVNMENRPLEAEGPEQEGEGQQAQQVSPPESSDSDDSTGSKEERGKENIEPQDREDHRYARMDEQPVDRLGEMMNNFRLQQQNFVELIEVQNKDNQKKFENALIKGMTKIAELRFGDQAEEYFNRAVDENRDQRTENLVAMRTALLEACDSNKMALNEQDRNAFVRESHHMESVEMVISQEQAATRTMVEITQSQMAEAIKSGYAHTNAAIIETSEVMRTVNTEIHESIRQENAQFRMEMKTTNMEICESIRQENSVFREHITKVMGEMVEAVQSLSHVVATSQREMADTMSQCVRQAVHDTAVETRGETNRALEKITNCISISCTNLQESVGVAVQDMSGVVDRAIARSGNTPVKNLKSELHYPSSGLSARGMTDYEPYEPKIGLVKVSAKKKNRDKKGDETYETDTTDSDDKSSHHSSDGSSRSNKSDASGTHMTRVKVPTFSGKEKWTVWFNRFNGIADRRNWNREQKLDILLTKMQGDAAEFVYDQLSDRHRKKYKLLVRELGNRFRTIENKETYEVKFDNRNKKTSETLEKYVAELRKLYDKAHPDRDSTVREEDILKRLLDGLGDDKAAFHIQVVKGIKSVDKAICEIINFQEVKKKRQKGKRARQARVMGNSSSSSDTEESESENDTYSRIARAPGRPPKTGKDDKTDDKASTSKDNGKMASMQDSIKTLGEQLQEMKKMNDDLRQEKEESEKTAAKVQKGNQSQYKNQGTKPGPKGYQGRAGQGARQNQGNSQAQGPRYPPLCFNCLQRGHFVRDCTFPTVTLSQMQITPNPALVGAAATSGTQQQQQSGNWQASYGGNNQNGAGSGPGPPLVATANAFQPQGNQGGPSQ